MTFAEYNTDDNFDKKESSLDELVKLGLAEGKTSDEIKSSLSPKWQNSKKIGEFDSYVSKYSTPKAEAPKPEEKAEVKETVEETTPPAKVGNETSSIISNKDKSFAEMQDGIADYGEDTENARQDELETKRHEDALERARKVGEDYGNINDHLVDNIPTFVLQRYKKGEFGEPGSKDAKLRLAHFMISGLQSTLKTASNAFAANAGRAPVFADTTSDYEKYQQTNLAKGLENRWKKNEAELDDAREILKSQNMNEQDIENSIAKVSANARLQSKFNMMNEDQKIYTLKVLSKIGNEIGNMNNKDFINTLIGFATSSDNLEWQEAAELLIAKFGPDALKGLKNIKDEDSMDDADTNTAGVGGGGNLKNYKTIDGDKVDFDMVFNNKNGGKEKLAKLTQDLSDKYYNGEIDEKTFREYYTPLYEEGKKHMSINIVSPDELLRKNNNTRVVELDEEFRKLNDQAKKGELSLDDYNKKYADLKENAKKWANDKQLASIDKNKVSDKKVTDAYTKAENKKNKKK